MSGLPYWELLLIATSWLWIPVALAVCGVLLWVLCKKCRGGSDGEDVQVSNPVVDYAHNEKVWKKLERLNRRYPPRRFTQDILYDTCTICHEEIKFGTWIRILSCGHVYHMYCIDKWFRKCDREHTCPNCKAMTDLEHSVEVSTEQTPLLSAAV